MAEYNRYFWVHFRFKDGSNPYIALRYDTFFFMIGKYFVYQESEFGFVVEEQRYDDKIYTLKYDDKKRVLRGFAQDWQRAYECFNYSYGELAEWQGFFEEYGKKYGLLREFRENGII